MTEDFLKVLLYLFQNYLLAELMQINNLQPIVVELHQAGFERNTSLAAIEWLSGIKQVEESLRYGKQVSNTDSQRVFCPAEIDKITTEARGFIIQLEQRGLIDALTRELIIDRAMALETKPVLAVEIRAIANMVLLRHHVNDPNLILFSEWLLKDQESIQ